MILNTCNTYFFFLYMHLPVSDWCRMRGLVLVLVVEAAVAGQPSTQDWTGLMAPGHRCPREQLAITTTLATPRCHQEELVGCTDQLTTALERWP